MGGKAACSYSTGWAGWPAVARTPEQGKKRNLNKTRGGQSCTGQSKEGSEALEPACSSCTEERHRKGVLFPPASQGPC